MRFDVVTIFPEYLAVLDVSLLGRARREGLVDVHVHDLRDFTVDRHRTVDDTPYGGGAGMVMKPEPWALALEHVAAQPVACLLVDEAQFLEAEQVDDLLRIAVLSEVPVMAYGIRTDFRTRSFPGSERLMELAHTLEELKTICRCGRKALFNTRKVGDDFVFEGDQVAIDGVAVTYESLCAACYLRESGGRLG